MDPELEFLADYGALILGAVLAILIGFQKRPEPPETQYADPDDYLTGWEERKRDEH